MVSQKDRGRIKVIFTAEVVESAEMNKIKTVEEHKIWEQFIVNAKKVVIARRNGCEAKPKQTIGKIPH